MKLKIFTGQTKNVEKEVNEWMVEMGPHIVRTEQSTVIDNDGGYSTLIVIITVWYSTTDKEKECPF